MTTLFKARTGLQVLKNFLQPKPEVITIPDRESHKRRQTAKKRFPPWFIKQTRALGDDELTKENKEFVKQVIKDRYPHPDVYGSPSPLKLHTIEPNIEWKPNYQRTGLIAQKIGIYPMWDKDGNKFLTTLFHVYDNHVIKYIPPEEANPMITNKKNTKPFTKGSLIVGAIGADPQLFTKQYCGMFNESGVLPKKMISRFIISPEAALQPGTPLFASHFQVGQYVDIIGKTIGRGFQGVMKRWGFHGMPASHGVTKTHRRPGNIGSGGTKARVMPGTKMPGMMGNNYRYLRAQEIVRINTKYNIIWVRGQASAGETNSLVKIFDTLVPLKSSRVLKKPPHFPTYFPDPDNDPLPEEMCGENIHQFNDPTIMYKED
ncbi:39S ribosomal protein L3, mitochondrial [Copidosoma floridanum]|uniref:39S ribosomal protein L3, mitochondrial n=1 Tax=Copidosoma floridanum TaxID=29053 RepID=UPI0006C990FE|nr:39S ribosomal protein L3, mitochondrial [Copidosoma floridanum]XP_023246224.1 39S ribosomal protein L3, mitochondrial [Copidosoma floridanum]